MSTTSASEYPHCSIKILGACTPDGAAPPGQVLGTPLKQNHVGFQVSVRSPSSSRLSKRRVLLSAVFDTAATCLHVCTGVARIPSLLNLQMNSSLVPLKAWASAV